MGHAEKDYIFKKTKFKKPPGSCPSLGRDSCTNISDCEVQANACNSSIGCDSTHSLKESDKNLYKNSNVTHYRTRFFYNSSVKPIEASLVRKSRNGVTHGKNVVKTGNFGTGVRPSQCKK